MKNIIKIFIILIVLLVGVSLFLVLQKKESEEQQEEPINHQLSQKEIVEQKVIEGKGEGYRRFSLEEGKEVNIIVTFYQPYFSSPLKEDHSGGILVFKVENNQIKRIWESDNEILLTIPRIWVKDITDDGKSEILALWSDGKIEALDIYSWTGDTFKLVTPKEKSTSPYAPEDSWYYAFGSYDGGIEVKDLDGDRIEEVIIMYEKFLDYDEETLESATEFYRRTYKWDGQEYYLWKEEKIEEGIEN